MKAKNAWLGSAVVLALAAAAPTSSAFAAVTQDPARSSADEAQARERAREVVRRENDNVRRRARLDRLTAIYERRGQNDRVAQLERLRQSDATAHRAAMARLEQDLGTDRYERLRNTMRGQLIARAQTQQQQRERAAAATREPRGADTRRPDARADTRSQRPVSRPAPRSGGRP
jgi:hypothetical protein